MESKQQINQIAQIICKSCFDSMDSVFDCNASEKPCKRAIDKAQALYDASCRIVENNNTVCPVCGQEMDETYHGRHYCKNCENNLKGKK